MNPMNAILEHTFTLFLTFPFCFFLYRSLTSSSLPPFQLRNMNKPHSFYLKISKKDNFLLILFFSWTSPTLSLHGRELLKGVDSHFPYFSPPVHLQPLQPCSRRNFLETVEAKGLWWPNYRHKRCFPVCIHIDLFAVPGSVDLIPEPTSPQPPAHTAATLSRHLPGPQTPTAQLPFH